MGYLPGTKKQNKILGDKQALVAMSSQNYQNRITDVQTKIYEPMWHFSPKTTLLSFLQNTFKAHALGSLPNINSQNYQHTTVAKKSGKVGPKTLFWALWTCPCKPFRSNVRARDLTVNNIMKVYTRKNCKKEGGKASLKVKGDGLGFSFRLPGVFFQIHFFWLGLPGHLYAAWNSKTIFVLDLGAVFVFWFVD